MLEKCIDSPGAMPGEYLYNRREAIPSYNDPRMKSNEPVKSYRKQFQPRHKLYAGVYLKEAIREVK